MVAYVVGSIVGGLLFGTMDMIKNANPLAVRLLAPYKPIARTAINVPAGIVIDLGYGFILAALFLLIAPSLPGASGAVKGLAFALVAWFLREAMSALSQWMMFAVPIRTLAYNAVAGLAEMAVLGLLYGLTL